MTMAVEGTGKMVYCLVLLASFVSMALGGGIAATAENGQPAPDVAALQAEIVRLKAEVAKLQVELDKARKEAAGGLAMVIHLREKLDKAEGGEPILRAVPRDGTELSLSQILAGWDGYWHAKTIITVIGGAYIEDDASSMGPHVVVFHLGELRSGGTIKTLGRLSATAWVEKAVAKPLVDAIGDATNQGLDGKTIRLKGWLVMDMTGKGGDKIQLHVIDYQLLDTASNTWGPWQPVSADPAPAKPAARSNPRPAPAPARPAR